MKLPQDPSRIVALVIGIEAYGVGVPELQGPAADALSFCRWLLGRGVPAKNIRCVINRAANVVRDPGHATNVLLQGIRQAGVFVGEEPKRTVLETELSAAELLKFNAPSNSLFILYWSGHGLMNHVTRQRLLLTCEAAPRAYSAINIEDQASFLRLSPLLRSFAQQLIIVDACSQYTRPDIAVTALSLPLGEYTEQRREQERIYASTDGETALIKSGETLSQFTKHLLEALPALEKTSALDFDVVWAGVKHSLVGSGKPFLVHRYSPQGQYDSLISGQDGARYRRTAELAEIFQKSEAFPLDVLQRAFRTVTNCDDAYSLPHRSAELIERLDAFPAREPSLSNADHFALRLCHHAEWRMGEQNLSAQHKQKLEMLREALTNWLQGSDQPAIVKRRAQLEAERRTPPHAFIDLGEAEARLWVRHGEQWQFVGRVVNQDNVTTLLKLSLRALIAAGYVTRNGHLEVAVFSGEIARLPLGADLSASPPRMLRFGMDLSVTLRIRDRWFDLELWNNWFDCWESCKGLLQENGQLDWLDRRKPAEPSPKPTSWVALHDLDDEAGLCRLLDHVWDGAPWALACRPAIADDFRRALEQAASRHAIEDWVGLTKNVTSRLKQDASPQQVLFVADSPNLPPGAADFLTVP